MAAKKTVKKTTAAKNTSHLESKDNKDSLRKEEIKEVVEETLETLLEENPREKTEEKDSKVETEEKPSIPVVSIPEPTTAEEPVASVVSDSGENSEKSEDTTNVTAPSIDVTMSEVKVPEMPSVQSPMEEKDEKEAEASPVMPSVAAPASPSVEPIGSAETNEPVKSSKKSPLFAILLLIIVFLLAIGGLWYATVNKLAPSNLLHMVGLSQKTATPTVKSVSIATPTPAQVDLSSYTVTVLNGSGVPGAAAKVKTSLTTAGFTVSSTGNGTSSDTTDTVIAAKAAVGKYFLTVLTKALSDTYIVSATVEPLPSTAATDVVVTLGTSTAH